MMKGVLYGLKKGTLILIYLSSVTTKRTVTHYIKKTLWNAHYHTHQVIQGPSLQLPTPGCRFSHSMYYSWTLEAFIRIVPTSCITWT